MLSEFTNKLVEKKDLKAFCHWRMKYLCMGKDLDKLEPKKRFPANKQILGRIKELRYIMKNIDNLKDLSKDFCHKVKSEDNHIESEGVIKVKSKFEGD